MKIWQLDPFGMTPYYDRALCQALANAGHEVHLFASAHPYDRAFASPNTYFIHEALYSFGQSMRHIMVRRILRLAGYLFGHRKLLAKLNADPPDVVHAQWCRLPLLDHWLLRRIRACGIPVIHTIHDIDPLFSFAFRRSLGRVYEAADHLVVHARANRERLLHRYPHLESRLAVIPHITVKWPEPQTSSKAFARESLGIPPRVPVLLFFGTSRRYKGLDILLEAVRVARCIIPEFWLIVAGRIDSPKELRTLRLLGDQIIVCPRYVPSDRLWLYHRAADIAVFPYRQVSQSGALITAMTFGLPVIASDAGAMPETIDGNGWVVSTNDVSALSQVIVEAIRDNGRLKQMGQRSLELIRERHASELVAQATLTLYEESRRSCGEFST